MQVQQRGDDAGQEGDEGVPEHIRGLRVHPHRVEGPEGAGVVPGLHRPDHPNERRT